MDSVGQRERRRSRRVHMKQALRVRPANPKDGRFEEVGTTKDVSQDGVYFVTKSEVYYEGMGLFVVVPYYPYAPQQSYEYFGQVVRVEQLENNERGIAISFRFSPAKKSKNPIV